MIALDAQEPPRGTVDRLAWHAWKLLLGFATVGVVSLFYFNASHLTIHRSFDLGTPLDHAIPFVPWTWWIYFPGYITMLLFSIVAFRSLPTYYRTLATVLLAQAVCTAGFLLLPSTFPRPTDAGVGLTADAIQWFWSFDPPNNTFPSMHVAISAVAALGMRADRNPLWWVTSILSLGVVITVHTTKQHYIADAVSGLAVAGVSFFLVFRRSPITVWRTWSERVA